MSSPYVTGPAFLYVGVSGGLTSKAPVFLGTCEDSPEVRINAEWIPLMNALGGSQIGSDTSFQGEKGFVRADLTKYNESVYAVMASRPFFTGTRGVTPFGGLGTLMLTENAYYPLWIQFPYFTTKTVMAAAGLPAGYRFFAAWLEGPDNLGPLSTKPRKLSLVWTCQRVFNATTLAWGLYDSSMAGLPTIN